MQHSAMPVVNSRHRAARFACRTQTNHALTPAQHLWLPIGHTAHDPHGPHHHPHTAHTSARNPRTLHTPPTPAPKPASGGCSRRPGVQPTMPLPGRPAPGQALYKWTQLDKGGVYIGEGVRRQSRAELGGTLACADLRGLLAVPTPAEHPAASLEASRDRDLVDDFHPEEVTNTPAAALAWVRPGGAARRVVAAPGAAEARSVGRHACACGHRGHVRR